jgi:hypothetical protein
MSTVSRKDKNIQETKTFPPPTSSCIKLRSERKTRSEENVLSSRLGALGESPDDDQRSTTLLQSKERKQQMQEETEHRLTKHENRRQKTESIRGQANQKKTPRPNKI